MVRACASFFDAYLLWIEYWLWKVCEKGDCLSVIKIGGVEVYVDDDLARKLGKIVKSVDTEDRDYFCAVDGAEGSGKSVLAMQLAMLCDPSFCLDRVVFNAEQFKEAILNGKKGQAIV